MAGRLTGAVCDIFGRAAKSTCFLGGNRQEWVFYKYYTAPIVQWIGLRFPVPSIGVRLPVGVWGGVADFREFLLGA